MALRIGVRGIAGITLAGVVGVNELLGVMGRANLLDRMLSHAFGWQVTPTFNLLVLVFGLALILAELRRRPPTASEAARVTPRLVARETRTIMIDPTDVSMNPGKPEDALLAAMAAFEYDSTLASGPRVIVRAELWFEQQGSPYRGGGQTAHVTSGYWRDAPRNQALFGPGVRHELVVVVEHRGMLKAIQDERADRSDLRSTIVGLGSHPIAPGHDIKIKLIQTDESSHERLAANTFHYVLNVGENELELVLIDDD
jgi:hypothetical protein